MAYPSCDEREGATEAFLCGFLAQGSPRVQKSTSLSAVCDDQASDKPGIRVIRDRHSPPPSMLDRVAGADAP